MDVPNIYEGNYKLLVVFPIALVLLSLVFIPNIKLGVDFRGGMRVGITTNSTINVQEIESLLTSNGYELEQVRSFDSPFGKAYEIELAPDKNIESLEVLKTEFKNATESYYELEAKLVSERNSSVSTNPELLALSDKAKGVASKIFNLEGKADDLSSVRIEDVERRVAESSSRIMDNSKQKVVSVLKTKIDVSNVSFVSVTSKLSSRFIDTAIWVLIMSGVLSLIVVFLVFRTAIPSIAVLSGALCDITIALGAMGFFGIPFTLASFAALLMLMGFSLDTDVLLTIRTLKHTEGTPKSRAFASMKTGITMSAATGFAFVVLFVLSQVTGITTYYEISAVALAGLAGDMVATWCLNAVIVLWYAESHQGKGNRGFGAMERKRNKISVFSS